MTERIRTVGRAEFGAGIDVLAFHLHRYLAHWLAKSGTQRVWVTVGFEHSTVPSVTIEVSRTHSSAAEVAWTFDDLTHGYRQGTQRVSGRFFSVPLTEESTDQVTTVIGYVVVESEADLDPAACAELQVHAGEAVRAARRNGIRLFLDETDEQDMKALVYAAFDRLPEWVGCDVAAALVLSNSLEAMSLDRAHESEFYVMAERLFVDPENGIEPPRLVGMYIDTRDDVRTVVDATIAHQQRNPALRCHRFRRTDAGYVDGNGEPAVSIGIVSDRPDDATSIIAPLLVEDGDDTELLGFLCLAFSGTAPMPRSAHELVVELAHDLARVLRYSPLFTLSASRLRLLRTIRKACERHVARQGVEPQMATPSALVADIVEIVQRETEVPAFSIGYIERRKGRRHVVYPASYGWTQFQAIDLLVDVDPLEPVDSGVSALAVRLGRPLVLAGGRQTGDLPEFKNFLWVHEGSGRIVDSRAPGGDVARPEDGWTKLGEYYKPARTGAYATVAYPITFDGEPLGIVAIEVDRDTNWTWWTGFGGQLLWELVASELAFAFRALGVQA